MMWRKALLALSNSKGVKKLEEYDPRQNPETEQMISEEFGMAVEQSKKLTEDY